MRANEFAFFRGFLNEFAETMYLLNMINGEKCGRLKSLGDDEETKAYAARLFADGTAEIPELETRLSLKRLREVDGKEFNYIEVFFTAKKRRPKRVCFVGHRFLRRVETTLRWNLRQVLEPYNIEVDWSGRDIRSEQILADIDKKIRKADFCIFDNRATQGRANVYVEVGMCYGLRKPFIFFDYVAGQKDRDRPRPIPSDLSFALAFRYKSYRELFRAFNPRLALFLVKNIR